ncbi:MAG: tetratricopeptide repeat protein [Flavobacteriales bacterium]|nr:tetratricopeptide repeat protein [Flavobacteriales bacterium]MBK6752779.1 tetratricopeptide repeat protein [Flavobacteriales bacterium]MBK7270212.1 tetratricopeptide repeat protein [Flavobacteriales bacterium]MBK7754069.1 tetratricopeptide repeat protein [Flavobacteriales bacterium]MBK9075885.1 tetratricopeptide repeat protein [Flavobacteriales bacterium]
MSAERLDQLRGMLAEEPGDVFLRYAIALELKRKGEMGPAIEALEKLLRDRPDHVASYYQLALMLADVGRNSEAIHTCEAGKLQCIVSGDRKARAELQELLASLEGD